MRRTIWGVAALVAALAVAVALDAPWNAASAQEREEKQENREEGRAEREARVIVQAGGQGGYLGVRIEDVDEEAVGRLGLPGERGARVTDVLEDTPAAEAGLVEDDVIVAWNGTPVESVAQLRRHLRETPPGRSVRLEVVRDGARRTLDVEVGEASGAFGRFLGPGFGERWTGPQFRERMEELRERLRHVEPGRARVHGGPMVLSFGRGRMGVGLQSLTEQLAEHFGLEDRKGALVNHVREDSPAARAGLKAGDVILAVGDERVEDPGDVARAVRGREAGPVEVRIQRDGAERTVTVELEEADRSGWIGPGGAPLGPLDIHLPDVTVALEGLEAADLDAVLAGVDESVEVAMEEARRALEGVGEVEIVVPEVDVPEVVLPDFEMPEMPEMPEIVIPDVEVLESPTVYY